MNRLFSSGHCLLYMLKLSMPRLTTSLLKQSSSSGRWLTRQRGDPFVRARAVAEGSSDTLYRSRSSFKLNSLAKKYPCLLPRGGLVIDLGAAPGEVFLLRLSEEHVADIALSSTRIDNEVI